LKNLTTYAKISIMSTLEMRASANRAVNEARGITTTRGNSAHATSARRSPRRQVESPASSKRDLTKETSTGVPLEYKVDAHPSIDKLAKLFVSATGHNPDENLQTWQSELDGAVKSVSVYADDALIGYVRANADPDDPEIAIVDDAMIMPRYQGRGIFGKMVQLGLQELGDAGYAEARFTANPGTEELYAHLGFVANSDGFSMNLADRQ
jgi:GNAT superfamily N-acetyltransferase